ncbi:calcineurin B-like protein 8 isoform X2 [Hibiscus syriacus]|uniref:calcineurin B-like protein 8 isoform X1 n=1 Tax=Hibiscus syriacus TaxID=106335 RepID=UPI0019232EE6|nr:calcineurin B-like protein 8 isoform X1 [Hibiscus syriacus]XP_039052843.1 calcineurin B-like protein 8 isoform X2 [Hibiscus syriacus]
MQSAKREDPVKLAAQTAFSVSEVEALFKLFEALFKLFKIISSSLDDDGLISKVNVSVIPPFPPVLLAFLQCGPELGLSHIYI